MNRDDEPVFKRNNYTGRYEYNLESPIGLALTVISVIVVVVMLILMKNQAGPFAPPPSPTWSPPPEDTQPNWTAPSGAPDAPPAPDPGTEHPSLP
ncbi:hypothetical protein ACWD4B_16675 [Streptomyces sp. NPDC002536]